MTPGAQIAASIEVLEMVETSWEEGRHIPVDAMLADYFRKRRYIGAKDKGFISRRVYTVLRKGGSLQWWAESHGLPITPRSMVLGAIVREEGPLTQTIIGYFSGNGYDAKTLSPAETEAVKAGADTTAMPEWMRLNVPEWCLPKLKSLFGSDLEAEIAALAQEAPMDLRVNTLKTTREQAQKQLKKEGYDTEPADYSPWGLRAAKRGALFTTRTFKDGWVEIQDVGSQLVSLMVDAKPGQKVVDFCAGAGGKTLSLAAQMDNKGRLLAWDISEKRMGQMPKRLARAGVNNVQRHVLTSETDPFIKRHKASADRVLIDVPCTGSGTWRRNPDLKWRSTEQDLIEMQAIQSAILNSAQRLVKPGGRLIYVTCSLYKEENEQQLDRFLDHHPDFALVSPRQIWDKIPQSMLGEDKPYLRLTPHRHGTDGFFAAIMEKTSES